MKDPSPKFSEEAKRRIPSRLKAAGNLLRANPKMLSLGGGLPHPSLFPYDKISAQMPKPPFSDGVDVPLTDDNSETFTIEKDPLAVADGDICLAKSLQYGAVRGEQDLLDFVKEHTRIVHNVPYPNWDLYMTIGATGAWHTILRCLVNPGDSILVEEFTYSSHLNGAQAIGACCVPAKMDLEGLLPEALDLQLEQWVGRKPKLLYTVPTGQNPTGSSLSVERREKIYQICLKHDIMIVEDDPYYYLQMPTYGADPVSAAKGDDEFPKSLIKSFLSMDTEGIVIRMETFSKVFAPGTRLGWVVAHPDVIEKLVMIAETTTQAPSGLSQSVVNGTLQRWGQEGFLKWLAGIRHAYTARRDNCVSAIEKHLPSELYKMDPPVAGMFVWLKLDGRRYKECEALGCDPTKIADDLFQAAAHKELIVTPGYWFKATDNTTPPQPTLPESDEDKKAVYLRVSFARLPLDMVDKAIQILGDVIREKFSEEIHKCSC